MPPQSLGRLTTIEAAARLGVSRRRVLQLIGDGRLRTERVADMHLIDPADLAAVKERKPGRPRKPKAKAVKRVKRK
jgi:excisionase family DNA binding protein